MAGQSAQQSAEFVCVGLVLELGTWNSCRRSTPAPSTVPYQIRRELSVNMPFRQKESSSRGGQGDHPYTDWPIDANASILI